MAALSERRLDQLIDKYVTVKEIATSKIPLIVTVARETDRPAVPELGVGAPGPVYAPKYVDSRESASELKRWLLASASLPYGVLPHVRRGDEVYVDGGMADNAPILPALEAGCRDIFVIHTNPTGLANGQQITEVDGLSSHLSRCIHLRSFAEHGSAWALDGAPIHFTARLIHIRPSVSTGSLIRSLLFGDRAFVQQLDDLGYRDTSIVLERIGLTAAVVESTHTGVVGT